MHDPPSRAFYTPYPREAQPRGSPLKKNASQNLNLRHSPVKISLNTRCHRQRPQLTTPSLLPPDQTSQSSQSNQSVSQSLLPPSYPILVLPMRTVPQKPLTKAQVDAEQPATVVLLSLASLPHLSSPLDRRHSPRRRHPPQTARLLPPPAASLHHRPLVIILHSSGG